jgi:hypothetical protein
LRTNLETAIVVLKKHREALAWADYEVAFDLVMQLGLDPAAEARRPAASDKKDSAHEQS